MQSGYGYDEGSSGAGGATGRVQAGRFILEIGSPAGTRAHFAPGTATAVPAELAFALRQPEPAETLAGAEEAVGEAASVTSRVERALELFTAVAQGRALDRRVLLKEVDVLIGALERLDREGRYRDALRLARVLAGLLALVMRWVALAETMKIALRAARALGDRGAEAWARHELGTLSLPAEDAAGANGNLQEALRLREQLRDEAGADVTRHNLAVARQAFGNGGGVSKTLVAALVAGAVLLAVVGVGVALLLREEDEPPVVDTAPPTVSFTETPESPTEERSAVFAFEADEEVRLFECRLDDGPFEECVSPHTIAGPLAIGEHLFRVRATDFAGNRGAPVRHTWTVERGVGPSVTIVEAPEPLVNETLAQFAVEAPDAIRLECRLDGEPFADCPTRPSFEVDEGEHVLLVRGLDAENRAGPPARHSWTVDTTAPTVQIGDLVLDGEALTVTVPFTVDESGSVVECVLLRRGEGGTEPDEVETQEDCASPAVFEQLEQGTAYLVRLTATDPAGNVGEPAEEEFATTPPVD